MGDVADSSYSERDDTVTDIQTGAETVAGTGVGNSAGTGAKKRDDVDGLEGLEGKVDITMLNKTNKIPILISYQFNV